MRRTILKYVLITILAIVILIMLLPVVFYIPVVQQGIASYATRLASEQLGMQIELERVRIRFPLDIELEKALIVTAENDTMLQCKSLVLDLGFKKILEKEIEIENLSFEQTKFHYVDSAATLNIKVDVDELKLEARPVNLATERITLPDIYLTGGDVSLDLVSTPPDTTSSSATIAWAFELSKLYLKDINYTMTTKPYATYLKSGIESAELSDAVVDLGKQSVTLSKANIEGALCNYLTSPSSGGSGDVKSESEGGESLPWVINVDTLSLERSNVTYGNLNYVPMNYFDPQYITLYNLNIFAENIYNKLAEVKLDLNHLSFYERSGIAISHANAKLSMDNSKISAKNLYFATNNSTIKGSVMADASILEQDPYANLSLKLDASLSLLDAPYFLPSISEVLPLMPTNIVEAKVDVGGYLSTIHLKELYLSLPENAYLKLTGDVANLTNSKPIKARASIEGELIKGALVQSFIGAPDSSSITVPDNISFNGRARVFGDTIITRMGLSVAQGSVTLRGGLNVEEESYNVAFSSKKFPLSKIIKDIGVGDVTTSIVASGKKFNPMQEGARADISLSVDTISYNNYDYSDIDMLIALSEGKYQGSLTSNSSGLKMSLSMNGLLTEQKQTINLKGDIPALDLQKLNFSEDKLSMISSVDLSASADTAGIYSVKGGLGTTTVRMYGAKRTLPGLDMDIVADTTKIRANIEAKGLHFNFKSPQSLDDFIAGIDTLSSEIKNQSDSIRYNIERIKALAPSFEASFTLDNNPIVTALLKRNGIELGLVEIDVNSQHNMPLYLKSNIRSLVSGNMRIDSISANVNQKSERLKYDLSVNGIKGADNKEGTIKLYGDIYDNILSLNCLQTDDSNLTGFDFGGKLAILPQSYNFTLTSPRPVMGYHKFSINDNNYINYDSDGTINADFVLISGEKMLSMQTKNDSINNLLLLKIKQLDIASMLKLYPLSPNIEGTLSADLGVNFAMERFGARGFVNIDSLQYEKRSVGDINLKAGYTLLQEGGQRVLVSLNLNEKDVVKLAGKYQPDEAESMKLKLIIESLPFSAINPFIPSDMASLTGALNGDFSLTGKDSDIKMNGYIQFQDVDLTLPSIGTTFTLSPEKITMKDNTITMHNFGMSGPNKKPMVVEGSVALGNIGSELFDINDIVSDVLITASNFQLVNVKKNNRTLVYGKAFSDMFMVAQGKLDNLMVAGNVALLNGTELTYTMRDGGMGQEEDVSDLVTFTAFTDTLNQDEVEIKHKRRLGVDMSVGVSIGQAVKVAVNLTPDAKSGIDIQGGGELLYTMNMLGDTQFTGRYSITSGTVRYSLPVVATKVFDIDNGSYIEWNGDIADPIMNITAQNKVRATVLENGNNNMVNFYVTIGIKNSLEDLDLSFNLSAPENMTITNELASMSEDQRSEQALSMLLYSTYTGVSATELNFDANTALGSFLSKELNQWASRTLKNVDLKFGVDSYTKADGESSLDYSYEFSKSLLNDRLRVSVGGSYNPDLLPNEVAQSILGDVSLEYQLDSRDNMLLKIFRSSTTDMLEGNISEYGVGFAVRKQVLKLKELFQITGRKEKVAEKKREKKEKKEVAKQEREEKQERKKSNLEN